MVSFWYIWCCFVSTPCEDPPFLYISYDSLDLCKPSENKSSKISYIYHRQQDTKYPRITEHPETKLARRSNHNHEEVWVVQWHRTVPCVTRLLLWLTHLIGNRSFKMGSRKREVHHTGALMSGDLYLPRSSRNVV
jgi:hypothetical protein